MGVGHIRWGVAIWPSLVESEMRERGLRIQEIVAACLTMGLAAAGISVAQEARGPVVDPVPVASGFGASMSTDRAGYRSGDTIRITFEVFNHTPAPVRFDFGNGQRYDVSVEDQLGNEVWRWSRGRMFTMALGQETVGPANPRLRYEIEYKADLAPGRYSIEGVLADTSGQLSAIVSVRVE